MSVSSQVSYIRSEEKRRIGESSVLARIPTSDDMSVCSQAFALLLFLLKGFTVLDYEESNPSSYTC